MQTRARVMMMVAVIGFAATAQAATVSAPKGGTSVSGGKGFQPITGQVVVKPGDMIMVKPGFTAELIYPVGAGASPCSVTLTPGAVVTVAAAPPCFATNVEVEATLVIVPAATIAGFALTPTTVTTVATGAVVAGGLAAGALLLTKPASP